MKHTWVDGVEGAFFRGVWIERFDPVTGKERWAISMEDCPPGKRCCIVALLPWTLESIMETGIL